MFGKEIKEKEKKIMSEAMERTRENKREEWKENSIEGLMSRAPKNDSVK
jgi:hypothetical protein